MSDCGTRVALVHEGRCGIAPNGGGCPMKTRASHPVAGCRPGIRSGQRAWLAGVALVLVILGPDHPGVRSARGQDEVRNFRRPILAVETGGHHARVRSLAWQDDFTLLSGGEDKVVRVWDFRDGARLVR